MRQSAEKAGVFVFASYLLLGCSQPARERNEIMLSTKTTAIERAVELLGFASKGISSSDAVQISAPGKLVPSIKEEQNVWKVHLEGIKVAEDGQTNPYVNSFDVYLTNDGRLLEAVSIVPSGLQVDPFPAPAQYEMQLPQVEQKYMNLTDFTPKVTFSDAIAKSTGTGGAKQIIVFLVEVSDPKWKVPRVVWVVHAWGMEPWAPVGGKPEDVPERARNHLRTLVDAQTGHTFGSNTIPQPK